jgi:hypothetical protein
VTRLERLARIRPHPAGPTCQYNSSGRVSLALIVLADSLATLLSGGIEPVKAYLYLLLSLMVCPFKFLDWPFVGRRAMLSLAPTMVTVVQKRDA